VSPKLDPKPVNVQRQAEGPAKVRTDYSQRGGAAEETAERVVRAFNTVFAAFMETGRRGEQQLSTFVASDDEAARKAGPLRNARLLEPVGQLIIQLALHGLGWQQFALEVLHD
jgi:predicted dinucleotide-binding enzyme